MSVAPTCLGLHIGHDRAITLACNGEITFHLAVERLDRRKHSDAARLPIVELDRVLRRLGLDARDLDACCVSYHGSRPDRNANTLEADFREAFPSFRGTFSTLNHHLAHALGAFACSPFEDALVLVADGAGDRRRYGTQAETLYYVSRETFYLITERLQATPYSYIAIPEFYDPNFFDDTDYNRQISLGLKYEQLTYLAGFGPGQAGQTMGLSAFGKPLFDQEPFRPRNFSFNLNYADILEQIGYCASSQNQTLRQFAANRSADVAATAQKFVEDALRSLTAHVADTYRPKRLCFAGGLFLNCAANRIIQDQHPELDLFVLPPCHDEGQSIGTAAYAHWLMTSALPGRSQAFPYLGFQYTYDECVRALSETGLKYSHHHDGALIDEISKLLDDGSIIGISRGRSESGPRALGHRSILADPRSLTTKRRLDESIKHRGRFRPYAPIMPVEAAAQFSDLSVNSPYMLLTAVLTADALRRMPAVAHIDGTARLQTVDADCERFLYRVLKQFEKRSGIPVLLNTSFNDRDEPIVETPFDAVRTFVRTDLDALVLGNFLVTKPARSDNQSTSS